MRDDAIATHFLGKLRFINNSCIIHELILNYAGYKDGVAPSKNYQKQTTSPLPNNACHKQPEEKLDDRTTYDVNGVEVTLGGENGLEHTTQGTRGCCNLLSQRADSTNQIF
jgi:hypothetical protein